MQKSHTERYCMAARVRGGWHSISWRWSEIGARQLDFNFGLPGIVGVGSLLISKWKSCCKDMWEHVKLFISPAESCAFCCLLVAPAYFLQATLPLLISYWALLSGAWTENRVEKTQDNFKPFFSSAAESSWGFFFPLYSYVLRVALQIMKRSQMPGVILWLLTPASTECFGTYVLKSAVVRAIHTCWILVVFWFVSFGTAIKYVNNMSNHIFPSLSLLLKERKGGGEASEEWFV